MRLDRLRPAAAAVAALLLTASTPMAGDAQTPDPRRIQARDGDVIVIDEADRVQIVRRRQAEIRTVYNAEQNWLLILADYATRPGGRPDGGVDVTYSFAELSGAWPLGERWQGRAVVEEHSLASQPGPRGLRLLTEAGAIEFSPFSTQEALPDSVDAVRILYRSSGAGGGGGESFDIAEERQAAVARQNAARRGQLPPGGAVSSGLEVSVGPVGGIVSSPHPSGGAPLRVGGAVLPPRKIADAAPILPEVARQAGMEGVVLLEVTIDATGSVSDARVLRSLPMLDEAALEAVRQWRYEPATLNGKPVPVVMTVPVDFRR